MKYNQLSLVIRCYNLPGIICGEHTNIRLGIQKGNEVIEDVAGDEQEVKFSISIKLVNKDECISFQGQHVHGKIGEKFIYLSWGQRLNEDWKIIRRAKLLLNKIPENELSKAIENKLSIHVDINMTDKKGGHLCASIKDENLSWKFINN